jgi:septal ring factor EnvC (AmiA/AmiB activator)
MWRALICAMLLAVAAPVAADPARQQELRELRSRIQALQAELEQATEGRTEAADALRHSERRISDVNRDLRRLAARQRELAENLRQIAADTRTTQAEIAHQQALLADLLRERYARGEAEALRLLLNGQDPGEIARNLEYYGYIARARAELIRQHRDALTRLTELQTRTREQNEQLERVRQEQVAQKKALEAEKQARQQVLYALSEQIRKQRREISTLERDEKRLTQLIARLARLAAQRAKAPPPAPAGPAAPPPRPGQPVERVADASLAGEQFARLKGRLALPVAGEIVGRYGQPREGGGPAWKGLFIRARQGNEVRAVGTGEVVFADWLRGFGNLIIIDHGAGFLSLYSNNESLYKQPGERARAGDVIASVGATGGQDEPGLYFELRHEGKPFDPLTWVR